MIATPPALSCTPLRKSLTKFCGVVVDLPPQPLATLAFCGVTAGGCFEYPGFVANLFEVPE